MPTEPTSHLPTPPTDSTETGDRRLEALPHGGEVLAHEQDPHLRVEPDSGTANPEPGRQINWVRPTDLLPNIGQQAGERVKQAYHNARQQPPPPSAEKSRDEDSSLAPSARRSRTRSDRSATSRQGIARASARSISLAR